MHAYMTVGCCAGAELTSRNRSCSVVTARLADGSGASNSAKLSPAAASARPACVGAQLKGVTIHSNVCFQATCLFKCFEQAPCR